MTLFPNRTDREARRWILAGAAIACLCTGACSHVDPYGISSRARPAPDDRRRILAPSGIAAPDYRGVRYVSRMYEELERVDERRMAIQDEIGRIGSERDLYDAALWLAVPLLAFSPSPKDVTKGAALLGAGYGYLNTRPREQVPILYDAMGRLTCLMVEYTAYLYTTQNFGELGTGGRYSRRHDELVDAITTFEAQAGAFLDAVPVHRAVTDTTGVKCAYKFSAACEERRKNQARTTPGNQSQIDMVRDYVTRQAEDANEEVLDLEAIEDRILRQAPHELGARAAFPLAAAGRLMHEARPALAAPGTVIGTLDTAPLGAATATAQSGRHAARIGTALPPLVADNDTARALRTSADVAARRLADTRRAAQGFIATHKAGVESSRRIARKYCASYPVADTTAPGAGTPRVEPLEP